MLRRFVSGIIIALTCLIGLESAFAQSAEQCKDILLFASRNIVSSVSVNDQRKSLFNQVCSSNSTDAGIDYKSAQAIFGGNYSSKNDYCSTEATALAAYTYQNVNSSLVHQAALQSYVECRKLASNGVVTDVSMPAGNPKIFVVGIMRANLNPISVSSVRLDPATTDCTYLKNGQPTPISSAFTAIGVQLGSTRWALSCSRKASSIGVGVVYPEVQMEVTTSVGSLPITLEEIGKASPSWATVINDRINAAYSQISSINKTIAIGAAFHSPQKVCFYDHRNVQTRLVNVPMDWKKDACNQLLGTVLPGVSPSAVTISKVCLNPSGVSAFKFDDPPNVAGNCGWD